MLSNILDKYFQSLTNNNVQFAVIGNYEELPYFTTNDVDLWVSSIDQAEKLLYDIAKESGFTLYLRNNTANGSNNYFYNTINPGFIFKIDLMTETAWKSFIPLVKSNIIIANLSIYNGFPVVNQYLEACMHLLFPLMTYGIVKEKYKAKLTIKATEAKFINLLQNIIGKHLTQEIIRHISQNNWESVIQLRDKLKLKLYVNLLVDLLSLQRLKIVFLHVQSILKRILGKDNGVCIALTGLDGAGKTTIKELLLLQSDRYFLKNKSKSFYWRPFLIPRLRKFIKRNNFENDRYLISGKRKIPSSLKNKMFSYIKFSLYTLDFIFGKFKYLRNLKTGGLVVFDRYYFDNIIYPERFGLLLPKKFMRWVDKRLIPQPDIIFYFTADTHLLYARKKELSIEEIERQKKLYEFEIKLKSNIIIIDNSKFSIDQTLAKVIATILCSESKRFKLINGK
jgi:thymidylate kinase